MEFQQRIKAKTPAKKFDWILSLIESSEVDLIIKVCPDDKSEKRRAVNLYWRTVREISKHTGMDMEEVDVFLRTKYAERIVLSDCSSAPMSIKDMAPAATFQYVERCITFANTELNIQI